MHFRIFVKRIMAHKIDILKGIHPGKIISRDLKKKNLSQRSFAASIGVHSQTLNAIINGRRQLTIELSLKIEQALGYEEGFLYALRAYYLVIEFKNKELSQSVSGIPNIRKSLFWDIDFDSIDWGRYKKAVIQRVLERGNKAEKKEIARFYNIDVTELESYKSSNYYRITKTKHSNDSITL